MIKGNRDNLNSILINEKVDKQIQKIGAIYM